MRDPHVKKLIYELNHDGTVDYKDPPPVEAEQKDFRLRLSKGRLRVEMLSHCAGIAEARDLVEPFLRTWETDAFLKSGKNHLHFEFADSEVVDRNPPGPGEPQVIHLSTATGVAHVSPATLIVGKNEYPKPPTYNSLSPDAETLATRYRGYRDDKEPLLAMAYFCLTVVEYRANNRKEAAKQYNLDFKVLKKLGELTSTRGDDSSARKYNPESNALTPKENTWIDCAVRCIIVQVAAVDAGEQPSILSMADLPQL